MLADMDLGDLCLIAKAVAICRVRTNLKNEPTAINLSLSDYDSGICVAPKNEDQPLLNEMFEEWAIPRRRGLARPGLYFTVPDDTGIVSTHAVRRVGPSRIERLLDGPE